MIKFQGSEAGVPGSFGQPSAPVPVSSIRLDLDPVSTVLADGSAGVTPAGGLIPSGALPTGPRGTAAAAHAEDATSWFRGAVTSACRDSPPRAGTSRDGRLSVRPGNLAADRCPAEKTDADGHRAADSWRSNSPRSPAFRATNSAPATLPAMWNHHASRRHFPPLGGRAAGLRRSSPTLRRTPPPPAAGSGRR